MTVENICFGRKIIKMIVDSYLSVIFLYVLLFSHYTVNACLFPLCAAHGLAITTVEGVGNPKTGLHEVQVRVC